MNQIREELNKRIRNIQEIIIDAGYTSNQFKFILEYLKEWEEEVKEIKKYGECSSCGTKKVYTVKELDEMYKEVEK